MLRAQKISDHVKRYVNKLMMPISPTFCLIFLELIDVLDCLQIVDHDQSQVVLWSQLALLVWTVVLIAKQHARPYTRLKASIV